MTGEKANYANAAASLLSAAALAFTALLFREFPAR